MTTALCVNLYAWNVWIQGKRCTVQSGNAAAAFGF
jgi:hypothetical protein